MGNNVAVIQTARIALALTCLLAAGCAGTMHTRPTEPVPPAPPVAPTTAPEPATATSPQTAPQAATPIESPRAAAPAVVEVAGTVEAVVKSAPIEPVVPAATVPIPGVMAPKAASPVVARDLTAVIALQGMPCGQVVSADKQGVDDYVVTCQDSNRYRVYVNPDGRVIVEKVD